VLGLPVRELANAQRPADLVFWREVLDYALEFSHQKDKNLAIEIANAVGKIFSS
jgi:hypothetical protein